MKGKIISTAIVIPVTFMFLWLIASSGLGVHGLIITAVVITTIFFSLLRIWNKPEPRS